MVLLTLILARCKGPEQATPEPEVAAEINTPSINIETEPVLSVMADPERPATNVRLPDFYPGQLCHWVRNIVEAPNGDLWMGTNHFGVMRYNGQRLDYFGPENGFPGNRVSGMLVDRSGSVWFASSDGLVRYQEGSFTTFTTADGLPSDYTWSLLLDDQDRLWVGTVSGLCVFDGTKCVPFEYPKAPVEKPEVHVSPDRVAGLIQDKEGQIWIATDGQGITIYDGTSFRFLTKEQGLADNNVSDLMQASDGRIWIGSMYGGMTLMDGDDILPITTQQGVQGVETGALYEDADGSIWFASEGYGVYCYDGQKFTQYYEEDGLLSGGIIRIFRDSKERFWFGGWKGLFRMQNERFEPVTRSGPWIED